MCHLSLADVIAINDQEFAVLKKKSFLGVKPLFPADGVARGENKLSLFTWRILCIAAQSGCTNKFKMADKLPPSQYSLELSSSFSLTEKQEAFLSPPVK